jgi:tetratricopeptide (TPR) repeat protein
MLARAARHHDQHTIAIKDDTFTAHRRRVLRICAGIQAQRLEIAWSCETRADHLDEEMLCAMRRAGCQRISLGVESGSPRILKNIRKGVTLPVVLKATQLAQKYGLQVRYYLMIGNRGETWDTFQETLAFISAAQPNQYIFTQLHLYPGTEEFDLFCRQGTIAADIYFRHEGLQLTCFAGCREDAERIGTFLKSRNGIQNYRPLSSQACKRIRARLPDLHWAHMDLAAAYIRERRFSRAERHLDQAVRKRFFFPGLVLNARACIAAGRGDVRAAEDYLHRAIECYPHAIVIENMKRLLAGASQSGQAEAGSLELKPGQDFETNHPCRPPETPEPRPNWQTAPTVNVSTASGLPDPTKPLNPYI